MATRAADALSGRAAPISSGFMDTDWMAMPFLILWGVVGLFVGAQFASDPERLEARYRKQVAVTRFTRRFADRHAPRESVIVMYRVGGYVSIALGWWG